MDTSEGETNSVRFGTRGNYEVVFELTLVAVVDKIHSGINVLVLDSGKMTNTGPPPTRIRADQIIAGTGQRHDAGRLTSLVPIDNPEPYDGIVPRSTAVES